MGEPRAIALKSIRRHALRLIEALPDEVSHAELVGGQIADTDYGELVNGLVENQRLLIALVQREDVTVDETATAALMPSDLVKNLLDRSRMYGLSGLVTS